MADNGARAANGFTEALCSPVRRFSMTMVTVAVIGGGSSMFVPGLVRRMLELEAFEDAELRLMDIDASRLEVMSDLATELAAAEGRKLSIVATTNQREALDDVSFAIIAISVGGMTAWESDIEVPAKYGVFMHIADSIGPGGIFRALRNLPVVASVARDLAEVSPRAMLFNYTNPASANAMAMAAVSPVRSASLCSCSPLPFQRTWLAELVGVDPDDLVMPMRVGGINHCTGVLSLSLRDGTDAMPLARARDMTKVVGWAIDTFGVIPYCWAHWTEFFPQLQRLEERYEGRAQGLAMRYGRRIYNMDQQRARMQGWEEVAARWSSEGGSHRLADLPHGPEDEGIVVAEVMQSVIEDRAEHFVVNVPNEGLISNLPECAVVEVPAVVNAEGVHPIGIGALPTGLAAVLGRHALVQRLTADAALKGDRAALRQAMTADPLLDATLEPPQIEALTAEMLEVNAAHLPLFAGATA
jgi:alpha-galactosidase